MSTTLPLNPNLPRWMRHANGDLPNPTPAEVQADFAENQRIATKEANGIPLTSEERRKDDATHEAIMHHYAKMQGYDSWEDRALSGIGGGIDWQRLHALIPWFAVIGALIMWAMFLLIPTAFGLHYAGMFPAMSNWSYVAMGLTLCLAAFRAAKTHQGVHAIGFTFAVLLLSYWF